MTPSADGENFYIIVGSSAGALIGLQFFVITLIADVPTWDDQVPVTGHPSLALEMTASFGLRPPPCLPRGDLPYSPRKPI